MYVGGVDHGSSGGDVCLIDLIKRMKLHVDSDEKWLWGGGSIVFMKKNCKRMKLVNRTWMIAGLLLIGMVAQAQEKEVVKNTEDENTGVESSDEEGVQFKVSGDVVSSYVWRGAYNAGASIQPTLGMAIKNFSLTVWGSKEISGLHKEIDITAAYSFGRFTVSVADYWWEGDKFWELEDNMSAKYFNLDNHDTRHRLEAALAYMISEKFPLSIAWNTMFWGADKNYKDGKQNYSSYVELNYPFSVKSVALMATVGFTPYESKNMYGTSGFDVCNVALGASKEIRLSDRFSLPIFTKVIFNPAAEDAHVVFGFTLR